MANVAKFFWGIVAAVAVLLAVPSCDWVRYPRALVEADSLAESNPREALAKLRGFLESCGDTFSKMERNADKLIDKIQQSEEQTKQKQSVKSDLRQLKTERLEKSKAPVIKEQAR